MGAKSTVDIKRDDAIAEIRQALGGSTNQQIADALGMLVGDERLENYFVTGNSRIVDDELFQERAAIREFDANTYRTDAEILARHDLAMLLYPGVRY